MLKLKSLMKSLRVKFIGHEGSGYTCIRTPQASLLLYLLHLLFHDNVTFHLSIIWRVRRRLRRGAVSENNNYEKTSKRFWLLCGNGRLTHQKEFSSYMAALYSKCTLFSYRVIVICRASNVELVGSFDGGRESTSAGRISRTDTRY